VRKVATPHELCTMSYTIIAALFKNIATFTI